VIEFLLGLLPMQELEIIDEQDVDRAKFVFERERILASERLDELVAKPLGGQVQHLRLWRAPFHLPSDRMQEMGLAEPDRSVNVQRVEAAHLA
jgi:hypothetical protein